MQPVPSPEQPPVATWAPPLPPTSSEQFTTPAAPADEVPPFLTTPWRWALASGWGMIMACLGLVANTGWVLGGEPFWLSTYVLAFLAPAAVLLAAAVDSRHTLRLSWLAVAVIAVIGVIDCFVSPAMGIAELVLAAVGLLVTIAAHAGRVPPTTSVGPTLEPAVRP